MDAGRELRGPLRAKECCRVEAIGKTLLSRRRLAGIPHQQSNQRVIPNKSLEHRIPFTRS